MYKNNLNNNVADTSKNPQPIGVSSQILTHEDLVFIRFKGNSVYSDDMIKFINDLIEYNNNFDFNATNIEGKSFLHLAIERDMPIFIEFLKENNVREDIKDIHGKLAYDYQIDKENTIPSTNINKLTVINSTKDSDRMSLGI